MKKTLTFITLTSSLFFSACGDSPDKAESSLAPASQSSSAAMTGTIDENKEPSLLEKTTDIGKETWDKTKEVTGETVDSVSNKSKEYYQATKQKAGEVGEAISDKSSELYDSAKEKTSEAYEATKETGAAMLDEVMPKEQ